MKSTGSAMIFLLFLIVLPVSRCEEAPPIPNNTSGVRLYLPFKSRELQTYSIISAEMFYDKDHSTKNISSDGIVDALWCQSSDPEAFGTWYFPNDTEVPTFDGEFGNDSAPRPVFAKSFDGQVALARREGLLGYEGLYKCVIPDENGVNQTLVAGIYRTIVYKANEGPRLSSAVTYNLISVLPLHALLNFNVTRSPPTYLNCTVNDTISLSFSRTVLDGPSSVTGVSVAVRERYAGRYEFMVSNNRVTDSETNKIISAIGDSRSLTIGVAEAPTGLVVMLTGSTTVQVSWSHPGTTPYRYEVFQVHKNRTQSVFNTSMDTITNIKGLTPGESYTFFVIAISLNTSSGILLPSEHSTLVSISIPSNEPSTTTSTSSTLMRSSMALTPSLISSSSQVVPTRSPSISQFPSNSPQPSVVRPTPGNVDDPDTSSVGLTAGIVLLSVLSFILLVLIVALIGGIVAISMTKPKKKKDQNKA